MLNPIRTNEYNWYRLITRLDRTFFSPRYGTMPDMSNDHRSIQISRSCHGDMIPVKRTCSIQTWRSSMYMLVGSDFRHVATAPVFKNHWLHMSCFWVQVAVSTPLSTIHDHPWLDVITSAAVLLQPWPGHVSRLAMYPWAISFFNSSGQFGEVSFWFLSLYIS